MQDCLICERLKSWKEGKNVSVIHEFKHSVFVVGDYQMDFYKGYSLILLKDHVRELHDLSEKIQQELFLEVMRAGKIINDCFKPWKMNYTCLGNKDQHIHWHIIPRYQIDPHHQSLPWTGIDFSQEERVSNDQAKKISSQISSCFINNFSQ